MSNSHSLVSRRPATYRFSFESSDSDDGCVGFVGLDGGGCDDVPSEAPAVRPPQSPILPLTTPVAQRTAHSTRSGKKTDGRGSYSRAGGKGSKELWPERASRHLTLYSEGTWLQEVPCDNKCSFGRHCLSRVTKLDVRDCATHTFGHDNYEKPPSTLHSQASEPDGCVRGDHNCTWLKVGAVVCVLRCVLKSNRLLDLVYYGVWILFLKKKQKPCSVYTSTRAQSDLHLGFSAERCQR